MAVRNAAPYSTICVTSPHPEPLERIPFQCGSRGHQTATANSCFDATRKCDPHPSKHYATSFVSSITSTCVIAHRSSINRGGHGLRLDQRNGIYSLMSELWRFDYDWRKNMTSVVVLKFRRPASRFQCVGSSNSSGRSLGIQVAAVNRYGAPRASFWCHQDSERLAGPFWDRRWRRSFFPKVSSTDKSGTLRTGRAAFQRDCWTRRNSTERCRTNVIPRDERLAGV